jgi:4-hydroxybenzoate polyprenyltransferase
MRQALLLSAALLLPFLAGLGSPRLTRAILGDLRLPRILYFVLLAALGMAFWVNGHGIPPWPQARWLALALDGAVLGLSLAYAAIFAIVTNNLEDQDADRISNPTRPLVSGRVAPRPYLWAGIACLAAALALSFAARLEIGCGILAISAGYWAYSCRPLRLKRVPFVGKFVIGLNSWFAALVGWCMIGGQLLAFPPVATLLLLVPMALAANFIDLKDVEGDRAQGVRTLPVLLGRARARHVIAIGTVLTYLLGGWLVGVAWVWPLNLLGLGLHLYFLYREPYHERWVFLILLGSLLGLCLGLLLPAVGALGRA